MSVNNHLNDFHFQLECLENSFFSALNDKPNDKSAYSEVTKEIEEFLENNRANIIDYPSYALSVSGFTQRISKLALFNTDNHALIFIKTIRKTTEFVESLKDWKSSQVTKDVNLSDEDYSSDEDSQSEGEPSIASYPSSEQLIEAYNEIKNAWITRSKKLALSYDLMILPQCIENLTHLTSLDLFHNRLTSFSDAIGQLTQLTSLSLCYNRLSGVSEIIGQLTQLTTLDFSNNYITSLPNAIGQLTSLKNLDFHDNRLSSLPDVIGKLTQLTHFDLSENYLTSLPNSIGGLQQLTHFDLTSNRLLILPNSIGELTELISLKLSSNILTILPNSIGQLTKLTLFNLSFNKLSCLPDTIEQLTKLSSLNLSENNLLNLPIILRKLPLLKDLTNNISLYIGDLNENIFNILKKIQETIEFFESLQQWKSSQTTLSEEKLEKIVNDMKKTWITNSQTLSLSSYALTELPSCIEKLQHLQHLDLSHNQLKVLPEAIGQFKQLTSLNLSHNQFTSLPDTIGLLTQLTSLDLSYNQLTSLPQMIEQLTQINIIKLSKNKLTTLPILLNNLTKLFVFDVSYNDLLRELPMSLGRLPNLIQLEIEGSQISQEQCNIILASCQALRVSQENAHLKLWIDTSGQNINISELLNSLTQMQIITLNDLLLRLEKTEDFKTCQHQLAKIVCRMMLTMITDNEFKDFFFAQAAANNEDCQDRSAMSLNEIYTYWYVKTLPKDTPITEALKIFERAAKTFTLRTLLSKIIDQRQKEIGNHIETEAVEIYLYYETRFRQKLNLLSAIESMTYIEIGERDWIDEYALEAAVESNYRKELVNSSAFFAFLERDLSFQKMWLPKFSDFANRMEMLFNRLSELKSSEYDQLCKNLSKEREISRKQTILDWLTLQCTSQSRKRSNSNSVEDQQNEKKKKNNK